MNRRDLLKLFGAGATAVPLVSGAPVLDAAARLVEPARVEPVQVTRIAGSLTDATGGLAEVYIAWPGGRPVRFRLADMTMSLTPTHAVRQLVGVERFPVAVAMVDLGSKVVLQGRLAPDDAGDLIRMYDQA